MVGEDVWSMNSGTMKIYLVIIVGLILVAALYIATLANFGIHIVSVEKHKFRQGEKIPIFLTNIAPGRCACLEPELRIMHANGSSVRYRPEFIDGMCDYVVCNFSPRWEKREVIWDGTVFPEPQFSHQAQTPTPVAPGEYILQYGTSVERIEIVNLE